MSARPAAWVSVDDPLRIIVSAVHSQRRLLCFGILFVLDSDNGIVTQQRHCRTEHSPTMAFHSGNVDAARVQHLLDLQYISKAFRGTGFILQNQFSRES